MLPIALTATFSLLALLHGYWLCGGRRGLAAALPEVAGRPAFLPSRIATACVAAGLAVCAALVAALAGWVMPPFGRGLLTAGSCALALLFLVRAIGDFRLVGLFKRVRGTRFARFDTLLYSPLCLGLALGLFLLAVRRPT